jgi:phytoene dehydrogenase-like protein
MELSPRPNDDRMTLTTPPRPASPVGATPDRSEPAETDLVVVGAGLAGLTAAAVAARRGLRVQVLDTRSPGGRARTDEREGFKLNQGAHALYRGGEARAALARLGIRPTGGPPATDRGRLLHDGTLHPLPGKPIALLRSKLLSPRSKVQVAKLLGTLPRVDASRLAGISGAAWLDDAGLRPDARALVETIIHVATYCHDLTGLSADAMVRQLQRALGDGVDYLDGGWSTLVRALTDTATAAGASVWTGDAVQHITGSAGRWEVATPDGTLTTRAVVIAVGGPAATRSLLPDDPGWGELGPDSEVACLDLGLRRLIDPPVVFSVDQPLYLSTHCPPADLAPEGQSVVQLMRYGVRSSTEDRADLWALASAAGIREDDVVTSRFLHRMVANHALPRPGSGLAGRPAVTVASSPGLFVAGDWVGPTGLLADAAVSSGEAAARAAAHHLQGLPQLVGR